MAKSTSNTPYSAKFVTAQKKRLLEERESVVAGIDADGEELRNWSGHDDAGIDQHMADDATALTEQEMDVTLIDNARYILSEIDEALARMNEGTYGWDRGGECWIREERLQALPWARREIEGQRRIEEKMRFSERDSYSIDPDVTSL
jgi:RNA polymerase-binding transcription factor DksA